MTDRRARFRTGFPEVDSRLTEILDVAGIQANRDILFEILATAVRLGTDEPDRLNLKITNAALREMREAFHVFQPYAQVPKVTVFGSARILPDDPFYVQARDCAAALARQGWMVITGAGPGIMAAGMEGAGTEQSFGINIRLPFEQGANPFIASDPKLVEMKYFFTRKLMLMKESDGFIILPGGFGTLDEMFELLTLIQTGKADPCPIVMLDVPGGTYWSGWADFIRDEVVARGLVSADDDDLYLITDDVTVAASEVLSFYRNYHSRRFVGDLLVLRLRSQPTSDDVEALNAEFADIVTRGRIEAIDATQIEVSEDDHPALPRIAFHFDRMHHAALRRMINTLNGLSSAPKETSMPER